MSDDSFDASTLGWVDLPNPVVISNQLAFFDVHEVYSADQDLAATFTFLDGSGVQTDDFVGIYKIGIKDLANCILHVFVNPDIMNVTFPAAELPHDDEANYLLVYVRGNVAVGRSAPFKIRTSKPCTEDSIPSSNPSSETGLSVDDVISDTESEEFLVVHSQLQEENSRLKTDLNRVLISLAAVKQEQEVATISFQKQVEKDKADMSELQKELSHLKADRHEANTAADFAKTQLEEVKCTIVDYMGCQAEIVAELHKVKNDLQNTTNEKSALADKLSESEMQEQKLQSTIKALQEESLASKEELIKSQKVLEEITNEKLALSDQLLMSKKKEQDLEKVMKDQAKRFATDFNKVSLELIDTKEKNEKQKTIVLELTEKIRKLGSEIRQKDAKLAEDVNVILAYHSRVQQLSDGRDSDHMDGMVDARFLRESLDANVLMLRAIEAGKQLAVQELATEKLEHDKLKSEKTFKDEECIELKAQIEALTRESSEAMKAKEAEYRTVKAKYDQLLHSFLRMTMADAEHQTVKAKCEELEHALLQERTVKDEECKALKTKIDVLMRKSSKDKVTLKKWKELFSSFKQNVMPLLEEGAVEELSEEELSDTMCDLQQRSQISATKQVDEEEAEMQKLCNEDEQLEKTEQFVDALTDVNNVTVEQPKNNEPKMQTEPIVVAADDAECLLSSERPTTENLTLTGNEAGDQQTKQVVEAGIDAENLCCKEVEEANAELKARLLEGAEIFKEQYREVKGLKKEVMKISTLRTADDFVKKPSQPRSSVVKNMLKTMQRSYRQSAKLMPPVSRPPPAVYVSDEEKAIRPLPTVNLLPRPVTLLPRPVNDCDTGEPVEKVPSLVPVEAEPLPVVEPKLLPKKETEPLPKKEAHPFSEKKDEPFPKQKTKLCKKNLAFPEETIFQLSCVIYENLPLPEISESEGPLLYLISTTGLFERVMSYDLPKEIHAIIHNNEVLHPKIASEPSCLIPVQMMHGNKYPETPTEVQLIPPITHMHETSTVSVSTSSGFFVSITMAELSPRLYQIVYNNWYMREYSDICGKSDRAPIYVYKPAPPYESLRKLKEYVENKDNCIRETYMGLRMGNQEVLLLLPVDKVFFPPPDSHFLDSNSENLAVEVCEIIEDMRKTLAKNNPAKKSSAEPCLSVSRQSNKLRKPDFLPTTDNRPSVPQSRETSEAIFGVRVPQSRETLEGIAGVRVPQLRETLEGIAGVRDPQLRETLEGIAGIRVPQSRETLEASVDIRPASPTKNVKNGSGKPLLRQVAVPFGKPRKDTFQCYGVTCPIMPPSGASKRSAYKPIYPRLTDSLIDGVRSLERKKAASGHDAAPVRPASFASIFYSSGSEDLDSPPGVSLVPPYDTVEDMTKGVNSLNLFMRDKPNTPVKTCSPLEVFEMRSMAKAASYQTAARNYTCAPQATATASNFIDLKTKMPTMESWNMPSKMQSVWQDMPDSRPIPLISYMTSSPIEEKLRKPSVNAPLFNRDGFQQPLPQGPLMTSSYLNRDDFQQPLPQNPSMSVLHLNRGVFQQPIPLKKISVDATRQSGVVDFQKLLPLKNSLEPDSYTGEGGYGRFFSKDPNPTEMKVKNASSEEASLCPPNKSYVVYSPGPVIDLVSPPSSPRPILDHAVQRPSSNSKVTNASVQMTNAWTPNYSNSVMDTTTMPMNPPYAHGNASVTNAVLLSSDLKPSVSAEQKEKKWTPNHLESVVNTPKVPVTSASAPATTSEMTTQPLSSDSKPAASAEHKDKKELSDEENKTKVTTVWCPTCNLALFTYEQDHLATLLKHMESSHDQTLCPICNDIFHLNEEAIRCFKIHVNSHFD